MSDIKIQFLHPTNGSLIDAELDPAMKPREVVEVLVEKGFMSPNPDGYELAIKNGHRIPGWQTFDDAGVDEGAVIRAFPRTQAGGYTATPPPKPPTPTKDLTLEDYRQQLVEGVREAQKDLDGTILKLSGGALGVSFAFLQFAVAGPYRLMGLLLAAWASWGLSMAVVLLSFLTSEYSLRRAISQVDAGAIRAESPGGQLSKTTRQFGAAGVLLFFCGLLFMVLFVYLNLAAVSR